MLKTRNRERILLEACLAARQPFVVDNTNPSAADRRRHIVPAAAEGFDVVGYYFRSSIQEGLAMNAGRERQVPPKAVVDTAKRLEPPRLDEGFTALFSVRMDGNGGFSVEAWDEVGLAG
jgi:predicted kinase